MAAQLKHCTGIDVLAESKASGTSLETVLLVSVKAGLSCACRQPPTAGKRYGNVHAARNTAFAGPVSDSVYMPMFDNSVCSWQLALQGLMEQSGNGSLLLPDLQKLASQLKPSAFIGRPGRPVPGWCLHRWQRAPD